MRPLLRIPTLFVAPALAGLAALAGCHSCERTKSSTLTAVADPPRADSGSEKGDAHAPDAPELPTSKIVPDIACTTSPSLDWLDDPESQFSASDWKTTSKGTSFLDASGAKVLPLDLTVAPGTDLAIAVGVKNDKGLTFAPLVVRYQLQDAPASAKVDTVAGKLLWKVDAPAGSMILFELAAHVKLPEGERCVKAPIAIRIVDDDDTRAHQIANKVRMNAFYRSLDCMWAHQGAVPEENANGDTDDEKNLRDALASGAPMVKVRMKDLNGDGLSDALVTFDQHAPLTPPSPPARWETGPGVQIHLRKGDDFVFAGEGPGELIEADDGTTVLLDSDNEEHALCPPRPYKSTGYPDCDITYVEVRKLAPGRFEWIGRHDGPEAPGAAEMGNCPRKNLIVKKDAKGRLIGFLDGSHLIAWNEKTAQTP